MKTILTILTAALTLTVSAAHPASKKAKSRAQIPNEHIDYDRFLEIAAETKATREDRRLTEEEFIAAAAEPGTVVLDARSADRFALRHIKCAVNLPFTDFTVESLARVIPAKTTRVLIYCNNNFSGSPVSFADKRMSAALNISTFVSLVTYGYTNAWELGPFLDVKKTKIVFEGTEVKQ